MRKQAGGFSLIELLIVVAIILIIAAIAIPNLLRSRIAANQASTVGSLRTLITAEFTYSASYNTGYSTTLSQLGPPASGAPNSTAAGLVDSLLAAGTKSGYTFSYTPSSETAGRTDAYSFNADPLIANVTGTAHYFVDSSGVIRQNNTVVAGSSDSPIAG